MFSIFKAQQIDLIRDKSTIFFTVIFPTVLVFILGTMLASLDNPDMKIEPMTIAYFVDGDDSQTRAAADAIVQEFDDTSQVEFIAGNDLTLAKTELAKGDLSALIVFTQVFDIQIYDGTNTIQNRAVHAIFESVARLYGTTSVLMGVSPGSSGGDLEVIPRVEEKIFGVSRTMIDYYAITMIVMMFFMGSLQSGAGALYNGRKDGSLKRTLASPISKVSVYLQYAISSVPYNLVQVAIVMVISTVFLGAHYAATWQANLLLFAMLFCTGLAASALSLIIGFIVRFNPAPLIMTIMWPMLFLSGTFSKEIFIPGFSNFLPPSIIQQAAFDLTLFGNTDKSLTVLLVSLAILLASSAVGAALFNRKELV